MTWLDRLIAALDAEIERTVSRRDVLRREIAAITAESELATNCSQLKLEAAAGKRYLTDVADTISREMAKRIGETYNISYKVFL